MCVDIDIIMYIVSAFAKQTVKFKMAAIYNFFKFSAFDIFLNIIENSVRETNMHVQQ